MNDILDIIYIDLSKLCYKFHPPTQLINLYHFTTRTQEQFYYTTVFIQMSDFYHVISFSFTRVMF